MYNHGTTRVQITKSAGHQLKSCKIRQKELLPLAPSPGLSNIYQSVTAEGVSGGCDPSNINETIIS
jgi:hypothetical protein